jgi:hypothetical protein
MHTLSADARRVLDRMEPDHRYEAQDLRAFVPEIGGERLRDVMHELWVNRQVERVEHSGWRRHRSASPHAPRSVSARAAAVKPEDLFDHGTFADFFK